MVYMAGDNDLDPNGVTDLGEMKRAGSNTKVNIVAQFDRSSGHSASRYYLRKGRSLQEDIVANIGRVDTGDPSALIDFIDWAVTTYPARHYALVLWNHGEGWDDTDLWADQRKRRYRKPPPRPLRDALFRQPVRALRAEAMTDPKARAILIDDNAMDLLDNKEMKQVLAHAVKRIGRKLDLLGMDACLMSMAEVAYQCRNGARYTVGSTETEPLEGWPYHPILSALTGKPGMTGHDLSRLIVQKYLRSYPASDQVTQSALDLSQVDEMSQAVRRLATLMRTSERRRELRRQLPLIREKVQYFDEDGDNVDLVDLCTLIKKATSDPQLSAACDAVIRVTGKLVIASGAQGDDLRHANGLSIYFPRRSVSPLYPGLDFCKRTGWDQFLRSYLSWLRRR
jgi:hypothetical protein